VRQFLTHGKFVEMRSGGRKGVEGSYYPA